MKRMSKTKLLSYLKCPMRFKFKYIDEIEEPRSEALERGKKNHEEIELFWKKVKIENGKIKFPEVSEQLKGFIKWQQKRFEENSNPKYFLPVLTEVKIFNEDRDIVGVIDAVFLNSDNEYIIIDWKSGNYHPLKIKNIRKEMAFYKLLLDESDLTDRPIKYWGQYFLGNRKLFFEKSSKRSVTNIIKTINKVNNLIKNGQFNCQISPLCRYCGYINICPMT